MTEQAEQFVPKLSVVVIFHNMRREAARTLYSLTPEYQHGVSEEDYEVIAVDSNSSEPLGEEYVTSFGTNFHYLQVEWAHPSPCRAMNIGVDKASGEVVVCVIDGARILSPGLLAKMNKAFEKYDDPFVYTLGMHIGPKLQNESMLEGYNQAVEDGLLDTVNWKERGYRLFAISSVALSSRDGFYSKLLESNCFGVRKTTYYDLGGFDERFITPGGGLINLDFFNRAVKNTKSKPVMLLGEATFHQFHGGVATNVLMEEHPWERFAEEYHSIRGSSYKPVYRRPLYFGDVPPEAVSLLNRRFSDIIKSWFM